MLKGIAPLIIASLVAGGVVFDANQAEAQDPTSVVKQALIDFETALTWEACQDSWHQDRDPWLARVRAARNAAAVSRELGVLEVAMKWEAVNDTWRGRRPSWVNEVAAAGSPQQVAQLLLDLELATTWEAMAQSWRTDRPGWVARLQAVAGNGGGGGGGGLAVGQNVEVLWNGTWYAASILALLPDGTVRIHYTGWASSWDENVTRDRIR